MSFDNNVTRAGRIARMAQVARLGAALHNAKMVAVLDHFGFPGPRLADLRQDVAARRWRLIFVKNTLARRVVEQSPMAGVAHWLDGPTALLVAQQDSHAALTWIVQYIRRELAKEPRAEWVRFQQNQSAFRQQWTLDQTRKSGNWTALPTPGPLLRVRGVWMQGHLLDAQQALEEAQLDPQEVYVRLLHVLQAPAQRVVRALAQGPEQLTRLLAHHAKEES